MTKRMKPSRMLLGVLVLALGTYASAAEKKKLPSGWFVTESVPQLYEASADPDPPCEGKRGASLRSVQTTPSGYGTFMQAFDAESFRGKRLRFSAMVRTEDVQGWAGLFMRVEGADPQEPLAFDNMQSRALKGTTACARYDVVLEVPREAQAVMAGLMLSGTGKAWISAVRFESVETSVAVTNLIADRPQGRPTVGWAGAFRFTADQADVNHDRFRPQPDGSWKDSSTNVLTLTHGEAGETVRGTLEDSPLLVTVKMGGTSTVIQGTWGGEELSVTLGADTLVMKKGELTRSLAREEEQPWREGTCLRYRDSRGRGDMLDICGLALSTSPPVLPLVIALLSNGFRATPPGGANAPGMSYLPGSPPRTAPNTSIPLAPALAPAPPRQATSPGVRR